MLPFLFKSGKARDPQILVFILSDKLNYIGILIHMLIYIDIMAIYELLHPEASLYGHVDNQERVLLQYA
mgnify:CR=1 FL=1